MSALKEMMTQEDAMNMSNEQAVQILIPMRNMMCDQNGCPISDAVFALDKAIESLSADVAPIRHGHWIEMSYDEYKCSACEKVVREEILYAIKPSDREDDPMHIANYCPNCGARMDAKE